MEKNFYLPQVVKIKKVVQEAPEIKTFIINNIHHKNGFIPGQFLKVSILGVGEIPLSISSVPEDGFFQFTFKRTGRITNELFELGKKDTLGIRGPFGKGFNVEELEKKDLIFIAQDIRLASLWSLFKHCLNQRKKFANISLIYGVKNPEDLLYKKQLESLSENNSISIHLAVEDAKNSWQGDTGGIIDLIEKLKIRAKNSVVLIAGVSDIMHNCVKKLLKKGMSKKSILLSLERHMQCGIGKCGHCCVGPYFVCKDGPAFRFSDLEKIPSQEIF